MECLGQQFYTINCYSAPYSCAYCFLLTIEHLVSFKVHSTKTHQLHK
uniref:Uncharacterized protein n=1 Tax=Arundo donax TaxID=35708 RepID=A0A0A9A6V3_ARUDO